MGQRRLAADLADRALHRGGETIAHLSQKAYCLLALNDTVGALELIERLAGKTLETASEYDALGNLLSQVGEQERALACFRSATRLDPEQAHHWLNLALCLQALGQMDDAEAAFDQCIDLDPDEGEAWLHRSRLRSQRADRNHVQPLSNRLQTAGVDWRLQMTLHYALAKELEDLGDYPQSFTHLRRGADLRRRHMRHDAAADLKAMEQVSEVFSPVWQQSVEPGYDSREPIFIVGLPRTGTTLVERILGSHSEVYAAGELNNFAETLTSLVAPSKPADRTEFIRLSSEVDFEALGQGYIESTRPLTGRTPRFVDKLPLNFLYCGLIHRALPRARIIHLRRDPMDTCFAMYKTLFKQAYPFSYDLQELGDYFGSYRRLMEHWHELMPGQILDLQYETLVADPESQIRRLLDYCEVPFENACVEFHKNKAPSMTASLAQVRQPVYASSVGRWRNYAEQLSGLQAQLEDLD